VSVWSQYRSYFSWPTEALLVGPTTSSQKRRLAWLASFAVGLALGLGWCRSSGRGMFTVREDEGFVSVLPVLTAVLFIPMVVFAAVLPRIGGPVLILASVTSILCCLPALEFSLQAIGLATATLYAPMLLVGLGFTWSGLRLETPE
jgi:hypothetical protein